MQQTKRNATLMLCEGAILVALAQVLGYLKSPSMPQGGSVSLFMLPILLYAFRWGWKQGVAAGFALGLLQFFLDGGIAISWQSMLGDYVVACTLLGLAGLFSGKRRGLFPGALLGVFSRYAAVVVTGATLWGEYMPEEFWGLPMANPWVYSLLYNTPVLLSGALCLAIIGLMYAKPSMRVYLTGEDMA